MSRSYTPKMRAIDCLVFLIITVKMKPHPYHNMLYPLSPLYSLYHDNEQLYDALESRDKEHSSEIAQLLKQHQTTMQKVRQPTLYIV